MADVAVPGLWNGGTMKYSIREATDADRRIWPHAMHVVEPIPVSNPIINPPSPYAPWWEREEHRRLVARFWGGTSP